ncbi:MAG: DUF11 domain-containing protein [Chloroflexaceae bacterium]|nr:DUF11 domain-containing protein [Chloroflexaceae bacterium]
MATRTGRWGAVALVLALLALLALPYAAPLAAAGPNLRESGVAIAPSTIGPGQNATVTVTVRNTGDSSETVDISAIVDPNLSVVAGSVSGGGNSTTGNGGNRVVSWNDVVVGAGASVSGTFEVQQASAVAQQTSATVKLSLAATSWRGMIGVNTGVVTLTPGAATPAPANLENSDKTASQQTLAFGEELTYSINLRNSGASAVTVNVSDPLDGRLEYVAGSATNSGAMNGNTLTWSNVNVPANGGVTLAFRVTPKVQVNAPSLLNNTATITPQGGQGFPRSVNVALVQQPIPNPNPNPMPILAGSTKTASKQMLKPGEEVTYNINLRNIGTASATVEVSDPLPELVELVAGSITAGGSYDAATRTIKWSGVQVAQNGGNATLSFRATAKTVTQPTPVANVATVTSSAMAGRDLPLRAMVLLLPADAPVPPPDDRPVVPQVTSLKVNDGQGVVTSRDVTLNIGASNGVAQMQVQEWQISGERLPKWEKVRESGWVNYQASYAWQLGDKSGTHAIAVQVRDAQGRTSPLVRSGIAVFSLLTPGTVDRGDMVPYLVNFEAGTKVNVTFTSSGNADLFVWGPGPLGLPGLTRPITSITEAGDGNNVSFTAERSGVYVFLVHGAADNSSYTLNIAPSGKQWPGVASSPAQGGNLPNLLVEPVVNLIGLDPWGVTAAATNNTTTVFLPVVTR